MRKIKSMLFTAGIAAVLAVGVGASVATTGRDAMRADAVENPATLTYNLDKNVLGLTASYVSLDKTVGSAENANFKLTVTGTLMGCFDSKTIQIKKNSGNIKFVGPENYVLNSANMVYSGGSLSFKASTDGTKFADITLNEIDPVKSFTQLIGDPGSKNCNVKTIKLIYSPYDPNAKSSILENSKLNVLKGMSCKLNVVSKNLSEKAEFTWSILSGAEFISLVDNKDNATVTGIAPGTATVKVLIKDGTYSNELTATIEILDCLSVAEAKGKADNTKVTVRAFVTFMHGNLTYYADKDGTGLQSYKLKGKSLAVGDEIIIEGTIDRRSGYINQQISGEVTTVLSHNNTVAIKHNNPEIIDETMMSDTVHIDDLVYVDSDVINEEINFKHLRKPADSSFDKTPLPAEKLTIPCRDYIIEDINKNGSLKQETAYSFDTVIGEANKTQAVIKIDKSTEFKVDNVATWLEYIINEDTVNQCKTKFAQAKSMFLALTEEEKNIVKEATDEITLSIKHRYERWASILGENPYAIGSATNNVALADNSLMITLIVVISAIAVTAISVLMIAKRKKATR